MWYINYDPPQDHMMTSFHCRGRSNKNIIIMMSSCTLVQYLTYHKFIQVTFSREFTCLLLWWSLYACYCSICAKLLKRECTSLEQSSYMWKIYKQMALFCWTHVIIAYTYITFNLVTSVSLGITLTYKCFSALVLTSLYMQSIFSP